jgi:hypothetical protein
MVRDVVWQPALPKSLPPLPKVRRRLRGSKAERKYLEVIDLKNFVLAKLALELPCRFFLLKDAVVAPRYSRNIQGQFGRVVTAGVTDAVLPRLLQPGGCLECLVEPRIVTVQF